MDLLAVFKFFIYIFCLRCVGIIYHQVFGIGGFVSDVVICQLSLLQVFLFIFIFIDAVNVFFFPQFLKEREMFHDCKTKVLHPSKW